MADVDSDLSESDIEELIAWARRTPLGNTDLHLPEELPDPEQAIAAEIQDAFEMKLTSFLAATVTAERSPLAKRWSDACEAAAKTVQFAAENAAQESANALQSLTSLELADATIKTAEHGDSASNVCRLSAKCLVAVLVQALACLLSVYPAGDLYLVARIRRKAEEAADLLPNLGLAARTASLASRDAVLSALEVGSTCKLTDPTMMDAISAAILADFSASAAADVTARAVTAARATAAQVEALDKTLALRTGAASRSEVPWSFDDFLEDEGRCE